MIIFNVPYRGTGGLMDLPLYNEGVIDYRTNAVPRLYKKIIVAVVFSQWVGALLSSGGQIGLVIWFPLYCKLFFLINCAESKWYPLPQGCMSIYISREVSNLFKHWNEKNPQITALAVA